MYDIEADSTGNTYITIEEEIGFIKEEPSLNFKYMEINGDKYVIGSAPQGVSIQKMRDGSLYFKFNNEFYYTKVFDDESLEFDTLEFDPFSSKLIWKTFTPIEVISQNDELFVEYPYDILATSSGRIFVTINNRTYDIEKESNAFYLKDRNKFSLTLKSFKSGSILNYLSEISTRYFRGQDELKQRFPKTFDVIDALVKSVTIRQDVTEHDIDRAIESSVSTEFVRREDEMQSWQKQAIAKYKQDISEINPVLLQELVEEEVKIYITDKLISKHPALRNENRNRIRDFESTVFLQGISDGENVFIRIVPFDNKVTIPHELWHAYEFAKYEMGDRPSDSPEVQTTMDNQMKKGPSNRLFGKSNHPYSSPQEFLAEGVGYFLKKEYKSELKDHCPDLYNLIEKEIEGIESSSNR